MRSVLLLLLLPACLGSSLGSGSRPAVMPKLSELPGDPGKRDAVLDQSNSTAGPEHRKPLATKRLRRAETAAATAAAILGDIFSSTKNVTLGTAISIDENDLVTPPQRRPTSPTEPAEKAPELEPTGPLVPWIKLD